MLSLHFLLSWLTSKSDSLLSFPLSAWPLFLILTLGGIPLVLELTFKMFKKEFSSDLIAGVSIVTSIAMGQYLAGSFVVLMVSGGKSLEAYALTSASSVLEALSKRMPQTAHLKTETAIIDIHLSKIKLGDHLLVMPHESSPVDGVVLEGQSTMDESYLTGEPYLLSKGPGSPILSGAVNGTSALTIRCEKLPQDSRYAKIMKVMEDSAKTRPNIKRLGDQLGAIYTPLALVIAGLTWAITQEPLRFLAVMVVATPCPLLIAIPIAIIGSISLAAKRNIIIKNPNVLENIDKCRTAIFDKTGTLTYGKPQLTQITTLSTLSDQNLLQLLASLERYSRHPLAGAILKQAERKQLPLKVASEISEKPGQGLEGRIEGKLIKITSRKLFSFQYPEQIKNLPPLHSGLECLIVIEHQLAGRAEFHDEVRSSGENFVKHLSPQHQFKRIVLLSGDREEEVRYLAGIVGIKEIHFSQTPEEKLSFIREAVKTGPTLFMGDGINDAPGLTAATVGLAFGQNSDITSAAAGAVILNTSLESVDELIHIGRRMRIIALQSAIGGILLSLGGMTLAAFGGLTPVAGAIFQEIIDILAILNALRVTIPPKNLIDFKVPIKTTL